MKAKKSSVKELAGDALLIAAYTVAKACADKIEKRMLKKEEDEADLQRKLTVTTIIYHAIGIFYNE